MGLPENLVFAGFLVNGFAFSLWIWVFTIISIYPRTITSYTGLYEPLTFAWYTGIAAGIFLISLVISVWKRFTVESATTEDKPEKEGESEKLLKTKAQEMFEKSKWNHYLKVSWLGFLLYLVSFILTLGTHIGFTTSDGLVLNRVSGYSSAASVVITNLTTLSKTNSALGALQTATLGNLSNAEFFANWMVIAGFILISTSLIVTSVIYFLLDYWTPETSMAHMFKNLFKIRKINQKINKKKATSDDTLWK